ncbi:hypothetical protein U8607_15380 [Methylobacterium durans]|uniref:hypothetical protein n=1 Tax=Methylobacterium durans TaxID=2202825 RepID=UPI002AFF8C24|nr:hypothetical protein [Methylobacterium durans]MEA1833466.1 hypothetical protein [Methylobacterium durans]
MMQQAPALPAPRFLPLLLVGVAAIVLSAALACATPFAALAALSALALPRRDALLCVGAAWCLNQGVGFGLLGYPWDASALAWGLAIGWAALLAVPAAAAVARRVKVARGLASLLAAFAVYEAVLVLAGLVLPGSAEAYAPAIVARLFLINLGTLAAALALSAAVGALAQRRIRAA